MSGGPVDLAAERRAARAAYMREWRKDNPEYSAKMREYRSNWAERNKAQNNEAQRVNKERARKDVLALLGGKCIRCGLDDWRALQVDHIHGNGFRDYRTKQNAHFFRRWLELHPEEAKEEYQILCASCNWIKRHENGEHPHAAHNKSEPRKVAPPPKGHLYTHNGETKRLREWAETTGLSFKVLRGRLDAGWAIEEALTTPVIQGLARKGRRAKWMPLTWRGETKALFEWAEHVGLEWKTLYERIKYRGWSLDDALTMPAKVGVTLKSMKMARDAA